MNSRDAILDIHNRWLALERAGKSDRALDLCANDVLWLIPGGEVLRGRAAVKRWLQSQPKGTIESLEITRLEIEVSGSLAVKTADFRTQLRLAQSAISSVISGTHFWVLREIAQGEWRIAKLTWSIADSAESKD